MKIRLIPNLHIFMPIEQKKKKNLHKIPYELNFYLPRFGLYFEL